MADRAASGASFRQQPDATPANDIKIKVKHFEFDPEIKIRRSITSDNFITGSMCVPCSVMESVGGILRCTIYVDPSDTKIAEILAIAGQPINAIHGLSFFKFILDITEAIGSRSGFSFMPLSGNINKDTMIFFTHISGQPDDAGMIEMDVEIHSQWGVRWLTNI